MRKTVLYPYERINKDIIYIIYYNIIYTKIDEIHFGNTQQSNTLIRAAVVY